MKSLKSALGHFSNQPPKLVYSLLLVGALASLFGLSILLASFVLRAQQAPLPNLDFVDAVWVATSDRILKVAAEDGAILFEISDVKKIRVVAVDEQGGVLWAFGDKTLHAFGFNGELLFSVPVPRPDDDDDDEVKEGRNKKGKDGKDIDKDKDDDDGHGDDDEDKDRDGEHKDENEDSRNGHVALAVNSNDWTVWLGIGKLLHHFDDQGQLLNTVNLSHNVQALALDQTTLRLWVATDRSVSLRDETGKEVLVLNLGRRPRVKDIDVDQGSGEVWVVLKRTLRRYAAEGTLLPFETDIRKLELVASDDQGGVWIATDESLIRLNSPDSSVLAAEVEIKDDEFEVEGTFTLGTGSNGIDPSTEEVRLEIGSFSTTIPADSFERDNSGKFGEFEFEGVIDGVELEVKIKPRGGNTFEFEAEGEGVDLSGTVTPVAVRLTIGDDVMRTTAVDEKIVDLAADPVDLSVWAAEKRALHHIGADGQILKTLEFKGRNRVFNLNGKIRDLALFVDIIPPVINVTAPAAGSLLNTNTPNITVTYSDVGIGVDAGTLHVQAHDMRVNCTVSETNASCTPSSPLPEGAVILTATVEDFAGNISEPAQVSFTIDTIAPAIFFTAPGAGSVVNTTTPTIQISYSDSGSGVNTTTFVLLSNGSDLTASCTIGDTGASCLPNPPFPEGPVTLTASIQDIAGNLSDLAEVTFTVETIAPPVITDFNPKTGPIGTVVTITGTNLNPVPGGTTVQFNGVPSTITTLSDTSLTTIVPFGATTGPIRVETAVRVATSSVDFTITLSQDFSLSVSPASGSAVQGDFTTYTVRATSDDGFSGLISLTAGASPLPEGLSASFSRSQITAGQSSFLTLTVDPTLPVGTIPLVVTGTSTGDGQTIPRQVSIFLNVLASGTTVLTGQVVTDDNIQQPIPNVTISLMSDPTNNDLTDGSGNFLLQNVPVGTQILVIDASTATTETDAFASVTTTVEVVADQTNRLPLLLHLPRISDADVFATPPNPPEDLVLTMPDVPDMSVTIPAGTTIISADGSTVVTEVQIVPLSADRSPMELPPGLDAGFIFTIQPEGAVPSQPVPIVYPNVTGIPPGTSGIRLFMLDVDLGEFVEYGTGTVSADGTSIIPDIDPATGKPFGLTKFGWHWAQNPENPSPPPGNEPGGDPVDMATGSLIQVNEDLTIGGGLTPIRFLRTYRTFNTNSGPFGIGTSLNWNIKLRVPDGQIPNTAQSLILVLSGNDRQIFARQSDGSFVNTTNPDLRGARITGNLITGPLTLREKDGSQMQFNGFSFQLGLASGQLIGVSDRNGNTTTITRGSRGNPIQITDASGRSLFVNFDSSNRVTSVTDPIDRTVSYTYNAAGLLETVSDPNGGVTTFAYVAQDRLVSITDPRGITSLINTYDEAGRVRTQQVADGGIFQFEYILANPDLPTSRVVETRMTDPLGNTIICRFNVSGEVISRTDALGQTTAFEREIGTNRLLSIIDPLGRKTSFTQDDNGNISSATDPDGNSTLFTYDPIFNKIISRIDALGQVTTSDYDENGNLIRVTDPLDNVTTITNNAFGQPVTISDPLGNVTSLSYDDNGDLTGIINPLGNQVSMTYDAVSRLIAWTDPRRNTTTIQYDDLDRITQLTDPQGETIAMTYDANHNFLSLTDANGNTTLFTYDVKNRRTSVTDPFGRQKTSTYDQADNLIQFTNRRGETTTFAYDALNRPIFTSFADGNETQARYDAVGNLLELTDVGGPVSFSYDQLDRVIRQTMPTGTIDYTYDALGRRTSATVAGREPITYTHDALDSLLSITRGVDAIQFAYDAIRRLLNITRPNGVDTEFTYDAASRLTSLTHQRDVTLLSRMEYTYDAAGNRVGFSTDNGQPFITQPVSQTFDAANRLLSSGATGFEYDEEGNLISIIAPGGMTQFTWNARNRLVAIDGPDLAASFTYDALGRRLSKTINSERTDFLYDFQNIIQESRDGMVVADYIPGLGLDEFFSRTDSSGTNFLLRSALGSTVLLTDTTGQIVNRYFYEPYGETTVTGTVANPFQYTGRENDETGLYYYRARYYAPQTGRFIREDPIGFAGGSANLYEYVLGNPINFTDPTGQFIHESIMNFLKLAFERPSSIEAVERYQEPTRARKRDIALQAIPPGAELVTAPFSALETVPATIISGIATR